MSCPTCASPSPKLHPAAQHEGEVQVCNDLYHHIASDELVKWPDTGRPDYLATLSADERAVYLAAFGAFAGTEPPQLERKLGAAARGKRAVRWFRELKDQGKL